MNTEFSDSEEGSEDLNISLDYSFHTHFEHDEGERYVKTIFVGVKNTTYDADDNASEQEIGGAKCYMIYLEEAIREDFSVYGVLDTHEYTLWLAEAFFDFEKMDFNDAVSDFYKGELYSKNICIIDTLQLLPAFRGTGIGAKVIEDIIFHFNAGGTMFVVQPFPLQFEREGTLTKRDPRLELDRFEKKPAKAFKKLSSFYERCGFRKIPAIKDVLFYNSALRDAV